MLRIDKILLITDFSAFSQPAVSHVAFWSARFDGEIHVLHIARRQKTAAMVAEKMAALAK